MLKYYNNIVLSNDKTDRGIGIITGWKKTNYIKELISSENLKKVKTIGPLYTSNGINYILANLFLNPQINHLILLRDSDINGNASKSIEDLISFICNGTINFEPKFKFTNLDYKELRMYFIKHISIINSSELNSTISNIYNNNLWRNEPKQIEEKEIKNVESLQSEKIGFTVRADTVKEAYLRCNKLIASYGCKKESDYDEKQLELMNMSIIVRNEDLYNPSMIGINGITKEEIEAYSNTLIDSNKPKGVEYTYGSRYRDYIGVDQLEYMVNKLKEKDYSRRAVATLWNPLIDTNNNLVPCINLYEAIIENNKLYLIAYFRANDMYNAYPRNIYGILKVQDELCKRLNVEKGYVNTIAGSAHIYERNFDVVSDLVNKNISFCDEDERGYFIIDLVDNKIRVSFYAKDGSLERTYEGINAETLRSKCSFHISNIDHALYLGEELMKAELALNNNLNYVQDAKLILK